MSVYVDDMFAPLGRMKMCHMIADSRTELDAMADQIGVARRWIQHEGKHSEHYDVSMGARTKAIALGATQVTQRELGRLLSARRPAPTSPCDRSTRPVSEPEMITVQISREDAEHASKSWHHSPSGSPTHFRFSEACRIALAAPLASPGATLTREQVAAVIDEKLQDALGWRDDRKSALVLADAVLTLLASPGAGTGEPTEDAMEAVHQAANDACDEFASSFTWKMRDDVLRAAMRAAPSAGPEPTTWQDGSDGYRLTFWQEDGEWMVTLDTPLQHTNARPGGSGKTREEALCHLVCALTLAVEERSKAAPPAGGEPSAPGAADTARLDWLEARLLRDNAISVKPWDHDGRRFVNGRLLVHRLAWRGGENETLRDAIDAACSAPTTEGQP